MLPPRYDLMPILMTKMYGEKHNILNKKEHEFGPFSTPLLKFCRN